jgi:hypothetical protein
MSGQLARATQARRVSDGASSSGETDTDRWLRGVPMPAGFRAEDLPSSSGDGFVLPEQAAEIMGCTEQRVIRLAQAHVLASRWDGFVWVIRPAVVGVTGRISRELMP